MSETFLSYLRKEQARLDHALERARAAGDAEEIASLVRQRGIVDDQLARWIDDLRFELSAA